MNNKGFTFVETIFSILIFSICAVGLIALYFQMIKNDEYANQSYCASLIAENCIVEIKACITEQINNGQLQLDSEFSIFLNKSSDDMEDLMQGYSAQVALKNASDGGEYFFAYDTDISNDFSHDLIVSSEHSIFDENSCNYAIKISIFNENVNITMFDLYSYR